MKKAIVIILSSVLVIGIVIMSIGLILSKGDWTVFRTDKREEARIDETAEITSLVLGSAIDNIKILPSEDDKLHIDYWTSEHHPYTYKVENGVAKLTAGYVFSFESLFSFFNFGKQMTVYVPTTVTEKLSITLSSGNLEFLNNTLELDEFKLVVSSGNSQISGGNLGDTKVTVSSGNVKISDTTINDGDFISSSGEVTLDGITGEDVDIGVSSGNIKIENSSFTSTTIGISSGDTSINDSTLGTFKIDKSSGTLRSERMVATSVTCTSSSGNSNINLVGKAADYKFDIEVSSGDISLTSTAESISISTDDRLQSGTGANLIKARSSSGDVKITFVAE